MCWAMHTVAVLSDTYYDMISFSDHNDVVGMTLKSDGSNLLFSVGDLLNDWSSAFVASANVWNHYCITSQAVDDPNVTGTGSGPVRVKGYANGIEVVSTDVAPDGGAGAANPAARALEAPLQNNLSAPPAGPSYISLFNSRASDSDAGAVFQGNIAAVKIWEGILTPEEIRREMFSLSPARRTGIWAFSPLTNINYATKNYGGTDWTLMGTDLTNGTAEPAGVVWDPGWRLRQTTNTAAIISAILSGTVTASITEADIVTGGKTIIITLSGDTWVLP
jgi:hypothetical protein